MKKLTRYSPGGFGAMIENAEELRKARERIAELEDDVKRLLGGVDAFEGLCRQYHDENLVARDLLRWRKVGEEMPETVALYLVLQGRMAKLLWWRGDCHDADDWKHFGVTHWRPIGPMPMEGEKL